MVDALVGILILAAAASAVSAAFGSLARLDRLQSSRIEAIVREADSGGHGDWY